MFTYLLIQRLNLKSIRFIFPSLIVAFREINCAHLLLTSTDLLLKHADQQLTKQTTIFLKLDV
jgi:hypothetical protein